MFLAFCLNNSVYILTFLKFNFSLRSNILKRLHSVEFIPLSGTYLLVNYLILYLLKIYISK